LVHNHAEHSRPGPSWLPTVVPRNPLTTNLLINIVPKGLLISITLKSLRENPLPQGPFPQAIPPELVLKFRGTDNRESKKNARSAKGLKWNARKLSVNLDNLATNDARLGTEKKCSKGTRRP
jgi:hypothetical protein